MLRTRVVLVAVLALVGLVQAPQAEATSVHALPAPTVGCGHGRCLFDAPDGVVHDGFRFQASSAPGAIGSVGWWEHASEQPAETYFIAAICNVIVDDGIFTDDECGPWSTVHQTPAALWDGYYTGTVNGYPCGGDLPPCRVLYRESKGDPTAQNPESTASGLWQFLDSTWARFKGYVKARYAPPDVQNDRAAETWDHGRGCAHWNAC